MLRTTPVTNPAAKQRILDVVTRNIKSQKHTVLLRAFWNYSVQYLEETTNKQEYMREYQE